MKIYCTVTLINDQKSFEFVTDVDPDLPWHEFIDKIQLHQRLDRLYPDWQGYDLNIDESDIVIPNMFGKLDVPTEEEEEQL